MASTKTGDTGTAAKLYNAECALHAAHQTGVDEWIAAAADALHVAVVQHEAALHRHRHAA